MYYFLDNATNPKYTHMVLLTLEDSDKLKLSKAAILIDEIVLWLNENIGYRNESWIWFIAGIIAFKEKEDAMAFILKWS